MTYWRTSLCHMTSHEQLTPSASSPAPSSSDCCQLPRLQVCGCSGLTSHIHRYFHQNKQHGGSSVATVSGCRGLTSYFHRYFHGDSSVPTVYASCYLFWWKYLWKSHVAILAASWLLLKLCLHQWVHCPIYKRSQVKKVNFMCLCSQPHGCYLSCV